MITLESRFYYFSGILSAILRPDDDEFLGFRHFFAALARHADAIEINARLQSLSAIDIEVPRERVGCVGRNVAFLVVPELASAHVEDVEFHIHHAARAVVVDDEGRGGSGGILRTTHVEKRRRKPFDHVERQLCRRGVVEHVPRAEK